MFSFNYKSFMIRAFHHFAGPMPTKMVLLLFQRDGVPDNNGLLFLFAGSRRWSLIIYLLFSPAALPETRTGLLNLFR